MKNLITCIDAIQAMQHVAAAGDTGFRRWMSASWNGLSEAQLVAAVVAPASGDVGICRVTSRFPDESPPLAHCQGTGAFSMVSVDFSLILQYSVSGILRVSENICSEDRKSVV